MHHIWSLTVVTFLPDLVHQSIVPKMVEAGAQKISRTQQLSFLLGWWLFANFSRSVRIFSYRMDSLTDTLVLPVVWKANT